MEKKSLYTSASKAVRSISREQIAHFTTSLFIAACVIASVALLWRSGLLQKMAANSAEESYIPVYWGLGAIIASLIAVFIIRKAILVNARSKIALKTQSLRKKNYSTEEIRAMIVQEARTYLRILTWEYTGKPATQRRMERTARLYIPLTKEECAEEAPAFLESPPKLLTHSPAATDQEDGTPLETSEDILTGEPLPSPRVLLRA